jgi:N-acetylglucosamine kinase-like BadF-type ATPase
MGTDYSPALVIDSGQTGIKARVIDPDGRSKETTFPGIRTNTALLPQLAQAIAEAKKQLDAGPERVAIGTSGLTAIESDPDELLRLAAPTGIRRVWLTHDSVSSYLGALRYRQGVVTAAGTGVITLGVGPGGVSRVDGWGNLIGDAGSGYWIGRLGLDQVMRAFDGRGPQTALTEVVLGQFPALDNAYIELQSDPDRVRRIAGFAPEVVALAESDPVCAEICARAGAELARSTATAAVNVGLDSPPRISLIGGVFQAEPVLRACVADLEARWPGFRPEPAAGDGLDGVQALFGLPADNPLAALVHTAVR